MPSKSHRTPSSMAVDQAQPDMVGEDFGSNAMQQDLLLSNSEDEVEEGSHQDIMDTIQMIEESLLDVSDEDAALFANDLREATSKRKLGRPADAADYGQTLSELDGEKSGFATIMEGTSRGEDKGVLKLFKTAQKASFKWGRMATRYTKRYGKKFER